MIPRLNESQLMSADAVVVETGGATAYGNTIQASGIYLYRAVGQAVNHANLAGASHDPGFIVQQSALGGVAMMSAQGISKGISIVKDGHAAVVRKLVG